jgi:hypothetical protein
MGAVAGVTALGGTAVAHDEGENPHEHLRVDDDWEHDPANNTYSNISAALDDAGEYDTINVRNGTYQPDSRLEISEPGVRLEGNSEGDVVIDGSNLPDDGQYSGAWTVYVSEGADDVTLKGFTVKNAPHDAVKANFVEGLAVEDVTVVGSDLSEMDLNNVRNAEISDVTLDGDGTAGVGLALSGVEDVTVDGVTTSGNTWGGIGVFDSDATHAGWDNITVSDGVTIANHTSTGEPIPVYSQSNTSDDVGDLIIKDATHLVENPNHKSNNDDYFAFYLHSEADAVAYATDDGAHADTSTTTVRTLARDSEGVVSPSDTFVVGDGMSIQAAVDAASDSDTIEIRPGTYETSSTITVSQDDLTIRGAGTGETVVDTSGVAGYGISTENGGSVSGLTVEGLTVVGPQQGNDTNYAFKLNPTTENVELQDVTVENSYKTGIDANGVDTLLLEDVTVSGTSSGNGISLADTQNVLVDGATIEDNTWGGIALYTNDDASLQGTHNVTIRNTEIVNNDGVGVYAQNSNQTANPFSDVTVENSTFENNGVHVAEIDTSNAIKQSGDWLDVSGIISNNDFDQKVVVRANGDVSAPAVFSDVQTATGVLEDGDTVHVGNGTYGLGSERLEVPADGITIEGESKTGVVIDGSGAPWPIYVHNKSDITLRNFTLLGTQQSESDDSIKVAFTDGLTIENVAVKGSTGNEIDLNNVRNATLRNVDALGEGTGGVGIGLAAVQNATLDDVHTSENTWGGVGLYDVASDVSAPAGWTLMQNTGDVTITTASDLTETVPLYSDQEYGGTLGDVYAPAYEYAVQNPDHRPRGDDFVFFTKSKSSATSLALTLDNSSSSTVRTLAKDEQDELDLGSTFVVVDGMSIQAAIDTADAGATVDVGPGTYEESLNVTVDGLTLRGPNAGVPAYSAQRGSEATVDANGSEWAIRIQEQSGTVIVDGFAVEGWTQVGVLQGMSDSEGTTVHVLNNDVDVAGQPVAHGNSIQVTGDNSRVVGNDVEVTGYDESYTDWATSGILAEGVNDTEILRNHVEYVDTGDVGKYHRGITVEGAPSFDGPANDNVVRNNTVVGLSTGISVQMDASNTTVAANTIVDSEVGLAVRKYQTRGKNNLVDDVAPTGVTVTGNSFEGNDVQVDDSLNVLDLDGVLDVNEFDRAVVVTSGDAIWAAIQLAVDAAQPGETVTVLPGTYDEDVTVDTSDLTLVGPDAGTVIEGQVVLRADGAVLDGFAVSPPPAESNADGEAIRITGTADDVVVKNNVVRNFTEAGVPEWEGIGGIVAFGGDETDPIENVSIVDNEVVRLDGRDTNGGAAGISIQGNVVGATAEDNVVSDIGNESTAWAFGIVVRGTGNHGEVPQNVDVLGNEISSVRSNPATDTVGVGFGVDANASEVEFHHNSITNVELSIENTDGHDLDAQLNWYGDDRATSATVEGSVVYDPFLTAPPGGVAEDRGDLQQFGHDLTVPGDGEMYAVGFPAALEDDTVADVFGEFDGTIWAFDADAQQWERAEADDRIGELDAVVVVANTETRAVIDFADSTGPAQPGSRDVRAGWNFVAAPQESGAETAFGASSADPERVIDTFADPGSQPMGIAGEEFGTHTFRGESGPQVSPYTGYWVYADEDGTIAVNGYEGMTLAEVSELLDARDGNE